MRRHAFLAQGLSFLLIAVACGPSDDPSADGGADAGNDIGTDRGTDAPLPDGAPDAPADAGPDVVADASFDALPDAPAPDAPDAPDDAADALDAPADSPADSPAPDAPYPPACGDGYRDLTEECDDGLGATPEPRACTETCRVVDRLASDDPLANMRWLASPQALASGPLGHAVALVEDVDIGPRVVTVLFDMAGRRLGTSTVPDVGFEVAPAIAALPDGDFALIVSQMGIDADGLGLGLYRVAASGGDPQLVDTVNESTEYGQHGPSVAWDGSELVVAWLDDSPSWNPQGSGRRVCVQRFDDTLARVGSESCYVEGDGWPSDLAVASKASSTAMGWRELHGYDDIIVVQGPGWSWQSDPLEATVAFQPPALAWIDTDTLLVVATAGECEQRAAVLEAGVEVLSFDAVPTVSGLPRCESSVSVTPDGIYLAWTEPEAAPDGGWDPTLAEVWLQKLVWNGSALDASAPPMPLPRETAHQNGDQHRPVLVPVVDPSQPAPGGALLASWNDLSPGNYQDQAQHGDVVIELIPTPIVRGPVY